MQIAESSEPLAAIKVYSSLGLEQKTAVWKFLDSMPGVSYHQFPEWKEVEGAKTYFFLATSGDGLQGFAAVGTKGSVLASLVHGPLAENGIVQLQLLQFILDFFKRKHISLFRWMPPFMDAGSETESVIKQGGKELNDPALLHWATQHVALFHSPEQLLSSFSEHHRRAIRKGLDARLHTAELKGEDEILEFSRGYIQMFRHRGHKVNERETVEQLKRLYQFITQTGRGFFICAKQEGVMLGGICILYGGKQALYHRGFLNHAYHHVPVNHLVFYQAMLKAREAGMAIFDMGGYALNTSDPQMQNINRFKAGFKGEQVRFPATRMLALNSMGSTIYQIKKWIRN